MQIINIFFCNIDLKCQSTLEATPFDYSELKLIDPSAINTEELQFDHGPADLNQVPHEEEEILVVEEKLFGHIIREG